MIKRNDTKLWKNVLYLYDKGGLLGVVHRAEFLPPQTSSPPVLVLSVLE
jgi:hypothetical protein